MRIILTLSLLIFGAASLHGQDAVDQQLTISNFSYERNQPVAKPKVRFIRFEKLEAAKKKSIEEDSSVMSYMLTKGMNLVTQRSALGVSVPQYNGKSEITYTDHGLTFIYKVPLILIDDQTKKKQAANETLSPWQKAKLEMSAKTQGINLSTARTSWNANYARPGFEKGIVDSLKVQIRQALENAGNFRDLASDDSITVLLYGSSSQPGHRSVLGWKVNMSEFSEGKPKNPNSIKTVEYTEQSGTQPVGFNNLIYQSPVGTSYAPFQNQNLNQNQRLNLNQAYDESQPNNPVLNKPKSDEYRK